MTENNGRSGQASGGVTVIPPSPYTEVRKSSGNKEKLGENTQMIPSTKVENSHGHPIYDAKKKTFLGRTSYNWARLAAFYSVFYLCLGCFFVIMLYIYALLIDREKPTYTHKESAMSVRSDALVVGMGFRPQPVVDDNVIIVSNDPYEQQRIASSLRLFRDYYLVQKADAKTEPCTDHEPAFDLPPGTACAFDWSDVVNTQLHPCSDENMYGFKNEEPCVLVKINKVYDWVPPRGAIPDRIQRLQGIFNNKTLSKPDVYVTCEGTHTVDKDVLHELIYYSVGHSDGSSRFGTIPSFYFPYRNAPDHVQPFILVQFKNLPLYRLISVTCRLWVSNFKHDSRTMRGMVTFQLYRTQKSKS